MKLIVKLITEANELCRTTSTKNKHLNLNSASIKKQFVEPTKHEFDKETCWPAAVPGKGIWHLNRPLQRFQSMGLWLLWWLRWLWLLQSWLALFIKVRQIVIWICCFLKSDIQYNNINDMFDGETNAHTERRPTTTTPFRRSVVPGNPILGCFSEHPPTPESKHPFPFPIMPHGDYLQPHCYRTWPCWYIHDPPNCPPKKTHGTIPNMVAKLMAVFTYWLSVPIWSLLFWPRFFGYRLATLTC